MKKYLFRIALASFVIALSACGGGGGGEETKSTPTSTSNGVFLDSSVIGLEYKSGKQKGLTDNNGLFVFENGNNVTFSIGDIVLGTGVGRTVMTPLNLVPGASNENNSTVTNIIRLTQTLDYDGNPENGIEIVNNVRTAAVGGYFQRIDVTEPASSFDRNPDVINAVRDLTAFNATGPRRLVGVNEAREHFSKVLIDLGLKNPDTQTCPNGDVIPIGDTCPSTTIKTCPDGTVVGINDECPVATKTCPDGTVVREDEVCPIETQTCPDGSTIPADETCPISTKTCEDGNVVLVTEECPTTSNKDSAGYTSDDVLRNYSGSFAGHMYDTSDDDITFGSNWRILFQTNGQVSLNSGTGQWNLAVQGDVVGVSSVAGCNYESTMTGYISSTGLLNMALTCNSLVWVEAQFSDNHYAARGPVYMNVGSPLEIGRFNGGHNDWEVDVRGKTRLDMLNLLGSDGTYGVFRGTDTNNVISGVLNSIIYLGYRNTNLLQYSFINFTGEYIFMDQPYMYHETSTYTNSYIGFRIPSSTVTIPSESRYPRIVSVLKSNGDMLIYSPYSYDDITFYGTPSSTAYLMYLHPNGSYSYGNVRVQNGRHGTLSSTSFFSVGERFEGTVEIFSQINP